MSSTARPGNVYSGNSAGETTATVNNGKTGQTNTYGAGHNGNDVYAGSDGNVYATTAAAGRGIPGNGWNSAGSTKTQRSRPLQPGAQRRR